MMQKAINIIKFCSLVLCLEITVLLFVRIQTQRADWFPQGKPGCGAAIFLLRSICIEMIASYGAWHRRRARERGAAVVKHHDTVIIF